MATTQKIYKAVTCTVGGSQAAGITELIGPGTMVYVTPASTVEPGTTLQTGHKVLVDYQLERQVFGDNHGVLALRVRSYGPDAADHVRLQRLLARLAAAGIPDPGFGDPVEFMAKLFEARLRQGTGTELSLEQELVRLLEAKQLRFPMDSWQHDIEPATSEMEDKLRAIGITSPLARPAIERVFEEFADDADDHVARRQFCRAIADAANRVLEAAGRAVRWYAFADLPWEDHEPFWLLVTPVQREGLLREKLFKPAKG